ncbi:hypothetical protein [Rhizobium sp. ZW T2_16]|uniref:hypothetical protein n=1 Tax=Rhizobium sp. ZW T2_16 TaxID=3378083 RepID=UPI0011D0C7C1
MDLNQTEPLAFSQMTAHQRDRVLVELAKSLAYTALASRTLSTNHHFRLEELGTQIERDHALLSADYEAAAKLVFEAITLIADFEYEMGRGETKH